MTTKLTEDALVEATSPEGHDVALAVWVEAAQDDERTDGCCVAALVNRTTGKTREQTISLARLAPRWRETAARKMAKLPSADQTPLILVPSARWR